MDRAARHQCEKEARKSSTAKYTSASCQVFKSASAKRSRRINASARQTANGNFEHIGDLPPHRRRRVSKQYRALKDRVESLRELRAIAGKAEANVLISLNIKQPSVAKIERRPICTSPP
jgi:hypothetical protein